MEMLNVINAVGRRKAAVARVYLMKGSGLVTINGKPHTEYFPQMHVQGKVLEALQVVEVEALYDVKVNVFGGGYKGQAEAIRMGIARALTILDAEFRPALKAQHFLTRDSRVVERKKYGQPKARRRFQFSKR